MVNVYVADISNLPDPAKYPELMNGLPEIRKSKILRYRQEKDRKQSFGAGLLLKKCLGNLGINMEDIRYGKNKKPEVDGICFNLSHSYDRVVCVVSERVVGCDIERIGELKEGIAERFFTNREIEHLNQFEDDTKRDEFYRLWTLKESYIKMTGEGISLALDRFEFVFDNGIKVIRDGELCSCNIKEYQVPGYKLAVCGEETEYASDVEYVNSTELY